MEFELPDGNKLTLPDGATGADAAAAIGRDWRGRRSAIKVDGELRDLARPLPDGRGRRAEARDRHRSQRRRGARR